VSAPATSETWFTGRAGAYKRQVGAKRAGRVKARAWPDGEAVALVSHTMSEEAQSELRSAFRVAGSQAMDSSVKLCRIAEGAADVYPRTGPTMEWDIAAGHAVLAAAGGRLTTPDGAPFAYGKCAEGFRNGPFTARGA
jgi:3'(2'), 5'-bisphosphate nucleotidase